MKALGKCLVFYVRHATEMARLYGVAEPKTDGLEDADCVLKMAQAVGQQASIEVADFLDECSAAIEPHLSTICKWKRARKPTEIAKQWATTYRIQSLGQTRRDKITLGIWLNEEFSALFPMMWFDKGEGGRRVEEAAVQILGPRADRQSREIQPGTVVLSRIPIPLLDNSDEIPTEPLVQDVTRSIAGLSRSDIDALLNV